jgi:CheY-like chemotaxis protein
VRVLFAHGRPVIREATARVLKAHGYEVELAATGTVARDRVKRQAPDALVIDVALPEIRGFELIPIAREHGVKVVVLVASVYHRTAYKRRPTRLYGADDYVEIHHLGDHLPDRLRERLGLEPKDVPEDEARLAYEKLRIEGDSRMKVETPGALASLIVADVLLYNGDSIAEAASLEEARLAVADDLEAAHRLFAQVDPTAHGAELIDDAFRSMFGAIPEEVLADGDAKAGRESP